MHFPNSGLFKMQRGCRSLQHCALDELRALARQHAFAGFSRIEKGSDVCFRHHCIDWNFHPDFARPRPNAWRFELSPDRSSFKEFSVAKDAHQQAVYMERWQRLEGGKSGTLALRRKATAAAPGAVSCALDCICNNQKTT